MNRNIVYYTVVLLVFTVSCKVSKVTDRGYDEKSDLVYYNTFTEATKHALLGNFKSAIALYEVCISSNPEKAAPYYQVSNIYVSVNDVERGRIYAKKAVELDSNNKWYLLHLANLYYYENKIDSIIPLYEKIVQLTDNPEYKYNLSVYYSKVGDISKSMSLLNELESEYFGMKEVFLMKHQNYSVLDEKDSAVYELENLVRLYPDETVNYGLLAEYLSEINEFDKAEKIYKELLEKDPINGLANISYGDFLIKQGKKDTALVYYKKGFECNDIKVEDKIGILYNYIYDPVSINSDSLFIKNLLEKLKEEHKTDSRVYTISADYYIKRQKYDIALEELKEAIEYDAKEYIVWEQYFMMSNYLGKYENVVNKYETAIQNFKDKPKLYVFSAYSLYELHEFNKSIEVSQKCLKDAELTKDDSVQVLNQVADAYRGLKLYDKSDSVYEDILKIDYENLLVRNNYSYYLSVRDKNLSRAEELSKLTIKKEPKNPTYLDTYGWIQYKLGNYKNALMYIELAIKNGAYSSSEVLEHYGDISYKLNKCNDAIEAWKEAIKYDEKRKVKLQDKIDKASENCN